MSGISRLSLKARVLGAVVAMVTLGLAITIGLFALKARELQNQAVKQYAEELGMRYATDVKRQLEMALAASRVLAQSLEGMQASGHADRASANAMLKNVLIANREFVGVWTVWEPQKFDGKDEQYANQPGYDATGRYVTWWFRDGEKIKLENPPDYEKEGVGDYYLIPKKAGKELLAEPSIYKLAGKDVLMTSFTVPIIRDGVFLGVIGIDMPLPGLQEKISKIRPYDTGYASLISNKGKYIADLDEKRLGQDIGTGLQWEQIKASIAAGREHAVTMHSEELKTTVRRLYVPIQIGDTNERWSLAVSIPVDKVMESVRGLEQIAFALAFISILIVSLVLSSVLNRLVIKPLGGDPDDAVKVARSVAQGDLAGVVVLRNGDDSSMMAAISTMQRKLHQTVTGIRSISESVAHSTTEIAQGNADLSRRTESQAASLEETAASGQQLVRIVEQNVDATNQANSTALSASDAADRAGDIVRDLVQTMHDISGASSRMAHIIDVIDGIAFQTNILALNASVEAARAGEQGRGFAVVANEVRSLAQRSALASKEIRELINASLEKVDSGAVLVEKAGGTIHEAMNRIKHVTSLMAEISSASAEQRSSITQISEAIDLLDETTQQNVTLVEQVAVAAAALQQQAQLLHESVAVFQTERNDMLAMKDHSVKALQAVA